MSWQQTPAAYLRTTAPNIKTNISREEEQAIKELREDHTRMMFAADKLVAMVVMDKQDYMDKAFNLLSDTST